jgi:curved DNA-binding protein CbpA
VPFPEFSPYEILGVPPSAGADEITAGFRRALAERRHDRRAVSQAYNELRNPRRRAEHDLLAQHDPAGTLDEVFAGLGDDSFLDPDPGPTPGAGVLADLTAAGVMPEPRDPPAPPHHVAAGDRFGPTEHDLPPLEFPL